LRGNLYGKDTKLFILSTKFYIRINLGFSPWRIIHRVLYIDTHDKGKAAIYEFLNNRLALAQMQIVHNSEKQNEYFDNLYAAAV
jgi:hypothetical protein